MPEFRQTFIDSTVESLELLHEKISLTKDFSGIFIAEIFRRIHTVKGTAQTFGLEKASLIAHELESVLSEVKNKQNSLSKKLLLESIEALKESFDKNNVENADDLIEKIKNSASTKKLSAKILPELPEQILNSLSNSETESLSAAFEKGKIIFCLEIYFGMKDFRVKILKFREILEKNGEIIATLSAAKRDLQIGFRFLFAGENNNEKIENAVAEFAPKIVFEISPIKNNVLQVLREIAAHGEDLAGKLNKKIEFEILAAEIAPSKNQIKIIFDALLHLTRNAIDHAVEIPSERIKKGKTKAGKIEIHLLRDGNNNLKIIVSDDGKGINAEKIKLKAIENKLISENKNLSESEILDLIFLSEFSTADKLSEISGRGVGLNAVRNEIESAGGTIKVSNREKNGAAFEIVLPSKNKKL